MFTIEIEKECGCFTKSGFEKVMTFDSKEDAYMRAKVIECRMNQEFCMKHFFEAVDYGDKIVIHSSLRPVEDDDEDINELISRQPITIGFSDKEETPHGKKDI